MRRLYSDIVLPALEPLVVMTRRGVLIDREAQAVMRERAQGELGLCRERVIVAAAEHLGSAFPEPPRVESCALHAAYDGLVYDIPKVVERVTRKGKEVTRRCPRCVELWGEMREYRESRAFKRAKRLQDFNPGSDDHKRWLLFEALGLEPVEVTDTGLPRVNLGTIQELAEDRRTPERHVPLLETLVSLAHVETRLNVFLDPPIEADERMHANFTLCGTANLRVRSGKLVGDPDKVLSEDDYNAQNVPKDVRRIWRAGPGKAFVAGDMAQIEWLATVVAARCVRGVEMYEQRRSVHIDNMRLLAPIMGWDVGEMPKEQVEYGYSKSFTHATDYGEGWFNLKRRFKVEAAQAKAGQRAYFDAWPEIERWQEGVRETVIERKELRTCFGFRRRFFDIKAVTARGKRVLTLDRKQFKEALATGPSSMNAALWLIGVRGLYDAGLEQVTGAHDDFVCEVEEERVEEAARVMEEVLTRPVPEFEELIGRRDFRPRVEIKVGRNLGPGDEGNPEGLRERR